MANQPPPPEGLPPPYEDSTDDYQSAYLEQREAEAAGDRGGLLQSRQTRDDDTDIDSLLESSSDERASLESVRREIEQLEIIEPSEPRTSFSTRAGLASQRIAISLSSKIISPVQRMFDPIALFFQFISMKFDTFISRFGNPLILKRLLYLIFVFVLIFVAFQAGVLPGSAKDAVGIGSSEYHDRETLVDFMKNSIKTDLLKERSEYLSSMPHLAGTAGDLTLAKYVKEELFSFGMKQVGLTEHSVYITYPNETDSAIQLHLLGEHPFTASMKEELVYDHPSESQTQPRPFHAFSASGEVQGPLVYINYGTKEELKYLKEQGISLEGCIVIMRNGKMDTGLKIKLAELAGAVGVITFSDRLNSNLGLWPNGPDYPDSGVERSSMAITALVPGDILSPGYSSIGNPRMIDEDAISNLPVIPAVPVSWKDVKPFLQAVKGYGIEMDGSDIPKLDEWWSGNNTGPEAKLVNYPVIKKRHSIWNVIGKLSGVEQKELAIIIGAKRDSWCYGAVGPMSGTSVMLEVARILTLMSSKLSWTPLRTIYFASWDGGDQNLAGTTEWVEYNIETLREQGAVYINLDDAISGTDLQIQGHPLLQTVMKHVLETVTDPVSNETISHHWDMANDMKPFDEAGDFLPFMSYAGIASVDLSFRGQRYPKNSCFDSFEWMKKFGDPDFAYHRTLVDIVSKLVLRMADDPVLPFDIGTYADALEKYTNDLERYAASQPAWATEGSQVLDNFGAIKDAASSMREVFQRFISFYSDWMSVVSNSGEPLGFLQMRWSWNERLASLDKLLLDDTGLVPLRPWFKHVVFGPQLWHPTRKQDGFLWGTFPAVRDSIEKGDWSEAKNILGIIGDRILGAVSRIRS